LASCGSIERLVATLGDPKTRGESAAVLARALSVDELFFLVRDPELGVLLPAQGFEEAVRGGAGWRRLLAEPLPPGVSTRQMVLREGEPARTLLTSVDADGGVLVVVGDAELVSELRQEVASLLAMQPLLSALLRVETAAWIAQGEARAAHDAGRLARELARALDLARLDLERSLQDAAHSNRELQEADRRKDEFLAMLGHELRNPMSAMTFAIGLMRAAARDPVVTDRALAVMERQSRHLQRLIGDLLDVSRLNSGKLTLQTARIELNDVVRQAVEASMPLVQERGHRLLARYGPPIQVIGDPTRLEQVTTNLVTNAAKYTDRGGQIEVEVRREGDRAILSVADSGIGIPAELIDRVFDPFVQVSGTFERSNGGLGLGLALVRELVRLHGGEASVKSQPGVGSVFTVALPVAQTAETVVTEKTAVGAPRPRSILVVDDNVDSGEMLVEVLVSLQQVAVHAADGTRALRLARELRPEIILLDLGLPDIDGFEVARLLRLEPGLAGTRIVALTGYARDEDREKARSVGFDSYAVKPLAFDELRALLTA
jgi:signal transduction histidine kinase/CheY-like chemotaxis protein